MLLILFYTALAALIVWSVVYLARRILRSLRGESTCKCGCEGCSKRSQCGK